MGISKTDKKWICIAVVALAVLIACIITACVYNNFAKGVSDNKFKIGENCDWEYDEVSGEQTYIFDITTAKNVNYYICVENKYGYVRDGNRVVISEGIAVGTAVPVKIVFIEKNHSLTTRLYNLAVKEII